MCFFDAQAQNHLGSRAFYNALMRKAKDVESDTTFEERRKMYEDELAFRKDMLAIISLDRIFDLYDTVDEAVQAHNG